MDTAYFVDKMDAIFSVDTSLVHLSGTMNKKKLFFISSACPDIQMRLE